ncbi:MAG: HAMP domain-containing sensor histidine kinase [Gallionella sp.]|nr:HAMP domain-containing histidine kinase [Gallionella sp.]
MDNPIKDSSSVDFWRSLNYFSFYRLTLAILLVVFGVAFSSELSLGVRSWKWFFITSLVYAVIVLLSFIPMRLRWPRFAWQLAIQVGGDIVGLTLLSYMSGGIRSNIGLLLLVSLAAASIISRGTNTLFFAALASLAMLLSHAYAVVYAEADISQYLQVGLLCVSYFAVAALTHVLAQYAVDSQDLAQRRGRDLFSMYEASRLVMRDMHDGVVVVDGEGIITQMNTCAERLLQKVFNRGSTLAQTFPMLFGQYAVWKQTGHTSRSTQPLDAGVQARLRFVAIDQSESSGAVIFLEDMQRVKAEAQQIKLAALGRLTANIAHEVRNPLSSISYATELMQEESVDANQQKLLKVVLDNTYRINQIVEDVMQLNKRDRAQPELFDLAEKLQVLIQEFNAAERISADIVVLSGISDVKIPFDVGHFHQVLWNLCRNALRYCSKSVGSVMLKVDVVNDQLVLAVQDDGVGVSAEQQSKLFEPFFTTTAEGTGLGLYVAKELCEANGARLEYREGQQGACFQIFFRGLDRYGARRKYDR